MYQPPPGSAPGYGAPPNTYGGGMMPPPSAGGAPAGYGPPGGAPPGAYGAPQYGAPSTGYGAPNTGYGAPSGAYGSPSAAYGGPPTASAPYGAPPGAQPGPTSAMMPPPASGYGGAGVSGYGAPPSAGSVPAFGGPPMGMGAPPASGSMAGPPASTYGGGAPAMPPPPKSNVQFFSVGGGAAAAQPAAAAGAPLGPGGFAPPPPSAGGMVGPPTGMPPPLMGAPPSNYPGALYGAPPATSMIGMPTAFDTQAAYGAGMGGVTPTGNVGTPMASGAPGVPGVVDPNAPQAGASARDLPSLEEMDLSIQCNPAFMRASVGKIVASQAQAASSRVPLGLVCRPMAGDVGVQNDQVDVVDFGTTGIVRCSRCRTYINPFVSWTDSGRRWRCCICGVLNDVPNSYFSHLDQNGQRRDKASRPELSRCSVEFIAPAEYMVRPPQPPAYFFAIDVSQAAAASGMLASCVRAIKDSLASLPGLPRTLIGFMTFDTSIHFYNLKSTLKAPQMLVISDVNDLILPSPEDLLVNLQESRAVVEALLDSLPSMFQSNSAVGSCTGPALSAAKRVIQHVGGKLCLFQTCLPNIGEGTLKPRDNPRLLGTDKEHTLLVADDNWYKNNAIDFSRLQIAVDTFLFANQYTDVATLSVLSKMTSGTAYYYPGFFAPRDGTKFESELRHCLTRATGFEAVMRVRATRGLRIANFHGNLFVRGSDLLALPNVTSDSTFAFDLAYDEPILAASVVTVQSALLYTTSSGERRIRVHTMLLPVTDSVTNMLETVDIDTAVNITAKQAVEIATKTGLEGARAKVHQACIDVLRASRTVPGGGYGMAPQQQQQAPSVPASLQLLPLYSMSLQKNVALRGGVDVRVDDRAFYMQLLCNMDVAESRVFVYPRMFSIHDMSLDAGTPSDNADEGVPTAGPKQVRLPAILNLSYERLNSEGIFLLENGYEMFLWVGRSVNPSIINTLFGVTSLEGADLASLRIDAESSDFSYRLDEVVQALRSERPERYMQLHIIREGDGYGEAYFSRYLVEDKANFSGGAVSYVEYHGIVTRPQGGVGVGGGGPGAGPVGMGGPGPMMAPAPAGGAPMGGPMMGTAPGQMMMGAPGGGHYMGPAGGMPPKY